MYRPLLTLLTSLLLIGECVALPRGSVLPEVMKNRGGTAVVLEIASNRVLASYHPQEAAMRRLAPGSTLKPLLLLELLRSGRLDARSTWSCPRALWINGVRVNCAHPASESSFDAEEALVWSCNSYFAHAALLFRPRELERLLESAGLTSATGLAAQEEVGRIIVAQAPEQRQLLALGVAGIEVTALELLEMYRGLASELSATDASAPQRLVRSALDQTVTRGMARSASLAGGSIAGKTGTVAGPGHGGEHGWFVGYAPAEHPRVAVVVRLDDARGMDAAYVGGKILAAYTEGAR